MPEGGGQGGGGGGHAVLEGSYELHDTVGTGGFAKVIQYNYTDVRCDVRIYLPAGTLNF